MGFLAPLAFALAALLPVIIAMYLLKLRRSEQPVASLFLWQRMLRDLEANAPWQRLRANLLLFLQLAFLIALIFSLAQPFIYVEGSTAQSAILIVDVSASMAASDVAPNRLEAARLQARRLIDGLPDGAEVTIIAAGETAQVLANSSTDQRALYQALDELQISSASSNLVPALELASAIAARKPATDVLILSDGRAILPERLALNAQVLYYPIGQHGENQAISLLNLELAPSADSLTALVQVSNYGSQPATRRLSIFADGQLVNAFQLTIQPGAQQAALAENLPLATGVVQAVLEGSDALTLDDRQWAVYQPPQPRPVTLVSRGNRFLETAVSLLPGVELTTLAPAEWEDAQAAAAAAETGADPAAPLLTIFDAYVPLTATLPAGNLWFIAPPATTGWFTVTGQTELPLIVQPDTPHALLQDVPDLEQVNVLRLNKVALPGWLRPLVNAIPTGDEAAALLPVLAIGEGDGRRIALLAFELQNSDLPLTTAFPALTSNLLGWLAPDVPAAIPDAAQLGETLSLNLPPEAESVQLVQPDGSRMAAAVDAGRAVLTGLNQTGIYQVNVQPDGASGSLAVNLTSPQESNLAPLGSLPFQTNLSDNNGTSATQQAQLVWWQPLALAGLALLVIEWLVYQRSTLNRWLHALRPAPPVSAPPKAGRR